MVELNLSEPCPCGSGKPGGECCWRGGLAFVVPEANPRPPAPKTGFAHPECYARSLNDCSDDISKEHYVSRNILESFAPSGRFDVVNPPWALGKTVPVSPGTFFARVLCRRHNNALIDLDTTGGNFFRAVMAGTDTKTAPQAFNGINLERWLLKLLCGLSAGKPADGPLPSAGPWVAPDLWARILFGELTFPPACGLYFDGTLGRQLNYAHQIGMERFDINGELAGLRVSLLGFALVLLMKAATPGALASIVLNGIWRPNGFEFRRPNGDLVKMLHLSWMQLGSGLGVHLVA